MIIPLTSDYEQLYRGHPKDGVVIHHTVTPDTARSVSYEIKHINAIARYHKDKFGIEFGYHAIVFPSGRAYEVGKLDTSRAHTKGADNDGKAWNSTKAGIAIVGTFLSQKPTPEAQEGVKELLRYYGLPVVGGHRDMRGNRTTCPGNWDYMKLNEHTPEDWDFTKTEDWNRLVHAVLSDRNIEPVRIDRAMDVYEVRMLRSTS